MLVVLARKGGALPLSPEDDSPRAHVFWLMTTEQAMNLKYLIRAALQAMVTQTETALSRSGLVLTIQTGTVITAEQARDASVQTQQALVEYIDALVYGA